MKQNDDDTFLVFPFSLCSPFSLTPVGQETEHRILKSHTEEEEQTKNQKEHPYPSPRAALRSAPSTSLLTTLFHFSTRRAAATLTS